MIKILKSELKEYNTQLLNIQREIKLTKQSLYHHREAYSQKLEYIEKSRETKNEKTEI
jgi:hypothetical protein